jgi:hypothetical protein
MCRPRSPLEGFWRASEIFAWPVLLVRPGLRHLPALDLRRLRE